MLCGVCFNGFGVVLDSECVRRVDNGSETLYLYRESERAWRIHVSADSCLLPQPRRTNSSVSCLYHFPLMALRRTQWGNPLLVSSTTDGDNKVKNQIASALVERILLAARRGQVFKVMVL